MNEEVKVSEVMDEIKNADDDTLKETIKKWYERTRTDGLKIGAKYMSTAIYSIIQKHIKKASPSLRDYKRMTDEILKIISVQFTEQNDSVETEVMEETTNDE